MPAKSGENSLKGKLGSKLAKAVASHKDDETVLPGGGNLPAGIENGIARLVDCRIGWYKEGDKKGEPFFIAAGIVVAPNSVRDDSGAMIPVVGLRTQIGPEPICDTPNNSRKTVDEHLGWVLNQMRLLGCDTSDLDEDSLESAMEALKEAAPYFRFRTWVGKATKEFPNPRVNHQWQGASGLEDYSPDSDDGGVEDSTGDEEEEAPPTPKAKAPAKRQPVPEPEPEDDDETPAEEYDASAEDSDAADSTPTVDEDEVRALSKKADRNDKKAQTALTKMAEELGIDSDEVENADNWIVVADLIIAAGGGGDDDDGGETEEPEAEEWKPQKEDVYRYHPLDPKTKKPSKKSVEVEVMTVDAKAETVTIKSLDDGKTTWKAVPWSKLIQD